MRRAVLPQPVLPIGDAPHVLLVTFADHMPRSVDLRPSGLNLSEAETTLRELYAGEPWTGSGGEAVARRVRWRLHHGSPHPAMVQRPSLHTPQHLGPLRHGLEPAVAARCEHQALDLGYVRVRLTP